uniref:DUF3700 domain-containing protein n=1 Tax=Meloidogyne hapla TaxID=6305 RepID=A0A1I8BB03_MELHA
MVELSNSQNPVELFYKGGIAQTLAAEIRDNGGFITVEDFEQYDSILHEAPLESELLSDELVMCGPPPPSSFAITQSIIGIMARFSFAKWISSLVPNEAQPLKYYSLDLTGHVPDHGEYSLFLLHDRNLGTSHVVAIDHEGNAVSATSSINQFSPNLTNAFGFAPSPENFILPKKRPMSSMSPTVTIKFILNIVPLT